MSLLSDYLKIHPSFQVEPNWLIKGMTEQTIAEMAAAIEEECREKGVDSVDLVLTCYIDNEVKFVNAKRINLGPEFRKENDATEMYVG